MVQSPQILRNFLHRLLFDRHQLHRLAINTTEITGQKCRPEIDSDDTIRPLHRIRVNLVNRMDGIFKTLSDGWIMKGWVDVRWVSVRVGMM